MGSATHVEKVNLARILGVCGGGIVSPQPTIWRNQ